VVEGMDVQTHRAAESLRDPSGIRIDGYRPKPFCSPDRLARAVTDATVPLAREVWARLKTDLNADVLDLQTACALHCAQATADALAAFHRRFKDARLEAQAPRPGVNLLANGGFERAGDLASVPAGWVVEWSDRADRLARVERRCVGGRWLAQATAPGHRVQMAPSWPRVARVAPGGCYRVSGQVKASGPAGVFIEALDASTRLLSRRDFTVSGKGWRETGGSIETGAGAAFVRAGLWAEKTVKPAQFAALSLVREA
ncbi:MAG TPA: hypothetical protein P5137_02075, partial [Candidatus Brocadiia bacterium]|nr:hypothetical protein [Candidatus Brocadiia bacterium]